MAVPRLIVVVGMLAAIFLGLLVTLAFGPGSSTGPFPVEEQQLLGP
jgi:hypothetical protein